MSPSSLRRWTWPIVAFLWCGAVPLEAAQDPCAGLPASGTRVVNRPCNPQQDCINAIPSGVRGPGRDTAVATCQRLPTSGTCPRTESTTPRQDCLNEMAKIQDLSNALASCQQSVQLLGDITAVLFELQKMASKEAREDAALSAEIRQAQIARKGAKLQNDNKTIDAQMAEAEEKAKNAMDAAITALETGIVSGALQVGSGAWTSTVGALRDAQTKAADLKRRMPPSPPFGIGLNLQRVIDQFVQLKARAQAAAKKADDEITRRKKK
jgi:hypothetical protein